MKKTRVRKNPTDILVLTTTIVQGHMGFGTPTGNHDMKALLSELDKLGSVDDTKSKCEPIGIVYRRVKK